MDPIHPKQIAVRTASVVVRRERVVIRRLKVRASWDFKGITNPVFIRVLPAVSVAIVVDACVRA